MTETEVLTKQEESGNSVFFIILIGRFLHAYGHGAFALARMTGYKVRRVQRKRGELLVLGFPIDLFDSVRNKLRDAGGEIEPLDSKTWIFRGVDGTPDMSMVKEPRVEPSAQPVAQTHEPATAQNKNVSTAVTESWLASAIRRFDLSTARPVDMMLFITNLKQRLQQQGNGDAPDQWNGDSDLACGNPSG